MPFNCVHNFWFEVCNHSTVTVKHVVRRQVDGFRIRIAGKSIPTEKFAAKKAQRYSSSNPVKLVVPALVRTHVHSYFHRINIVVKPALIFKQLFLSLPQEMMYVWNGFTVVGKRPELTESILIILEEAEQQLRQNPGAFFFYFFFLTADQYVYFFSTDMKLNSIEFNL